MVSSSLALVTLFWTLFSTVCCEPRRLCTRSNIERVARVVFGEAANQPYQGQLAVAYTVANRVGHPGYPNTVKAVLDATYNHNGKPMHEYETLSRQDHTDNWNREKTRRSAVAKQIVKAAQAALCKSLTDKDPTKCAVVFCYPAGCSAIQDNPWWRVHDIIKIGDHWFGCKSAKSG